MVRQQLYEGLSLAARQRRSYHYMRTIPHVAKEALAEARDYIKGSTARIPADRAASLLTG
jgi:hypothetical protein